MTIISSADLAILQHQQNSPASGRSGKDRVMEKRFDKYGYPAAREIVAGRQMNLSELEFIHLLQDELGIFELNRSVYGKKPMTQITVFNLERKPLFHTDMVAISGLTCSELPYLIRDCVYDIGNKLEGIKVDDSTTMHLILSLFSKQRYTIERAAEPDHGTVLELARKLFSGAILQDDEMWLRLQRWYEAEIHDVPFDVLPLKDLAAMIRTVLRETPPDQGRNTSGVHADKPGPEFTKRTMVSQKNLNFLYDDAVKPSASEERFLARAKDPESSRLGAADAAKRSLSTKGKILSVASLKEPKTANELAIEVIAKFNVRGQENIRKRAMELCRQDGMLKDCGMKLCSFSGAQASGFCLVEKD